MHISYNGHSSQKLSKFGGRRHYDIPTHIFRGGQTKKNKKKSAEISEESANAVNTTHKRTFAVMVISA